jgi:hypothetical protein
MSVYKKDINQYDAAEIRRYLRGEMTASEMHAMESAALSDPFLADAIEGFTQAYNEKGIETVGKQLEILKNELDDKINKRNARSLTAFHLKWWQTAAAAAILITAGVLAYRTFSIKNDSAVLAVNETAAKKQAPKQNFTDQDSTQKPTNLLPPDTSFKDSSTERNSLQNTIAKTRQKRADRQVTPLLTAEDSQAALFDRSTKAEETEQAARLETEKKNADQAYVPAPGSSGPREVMKRTTSVNIAGYFRGQLVDNYNNPLSNVPIKLTNDQRVFSTDNNGNFVIPSSDSTIEVEIAAIGRETKHFRLDKDQNINRLVLPADTAAMAEVVVLGYGTQRKKDISRSRTVRILDAEPAGGWIEFEKYIEINKDSSLNRNPSQETVVSFLVKKNGQLSDFRIEKSISPLHDAEALRLIKKGPAWRLLKGRKTRSTVIIRF